ncbi:MAG: DUF72 domain-containing protein [Candidatus Brockarchaeota archaeon]|nr:DUF72 domain-containing protein [Candidatus Brockarchaeota archaeon]
MDNIVVGTSGWSYKDWLNVFYTSSEKMFKQYADVFKTVEVDSTFYKQPNLGFIRTITRSSPKGFVFSLKVPKTVTHVKLMDLEKGALRDLKLFLSALAPLKEDGKLGPLLFQLPPKPAAAFKGFKEFLESLPEGYDFTVEFRHPTWLIDESFRILSENNVGYCIVDEPLLPALLKVTGDFSYVRFHGRGNRPWYYYDYRIEELEEWKGKLEELSSKAKKVYVYFNNHFRGYAVKNALQMMRIVGVMEKPQEEALNRVLNYFEEQGLRRTVSKVEAVLSSGEKGIEKLVSAFLEGGRLERARELVGKVVVEEAGEEKVKAKVKEYAVIINIPDRRLKHDCQDWVKRIGQKQFCKHVAALFLAMRPEESMRILTLICKNLDSWVFEAGASEA